jgi:hypothetical protein
LDQNIEETSLNKNLGGAYTGNQEKLLQNSRMKVWKLKHTQMHSPNQRSELADEKFMAVDDAYFDGVLL